MWRAVSGRVRRKTSLFLANFADLAVQKWSRMNVTLNDILKAAGRIKPHAHRALVLTCESLDQQVGAGHQLMQVEMISQMQFPSSLAMYLKKHPNSD